MCVFIVKSTCFNSNDGNYIKGVELCELFSLQVLVVNTNLYYAFNRLGVGEPDPCGQFAWLRNKLQQARNQSSKVSLFIYLMAVYSILL